MPKFVNLKRKKINEIIRSRNYYKVFDCGNDKYLWTRD